LKRIKQATVVLLAFMLMFAGIPAAYAEYGQLTYDVTYSSEDLSTPTDWYNSSYFDNPAYKENRFHQYWWWTDIAPGGARDTGLYVVFNEEGVNIFFQQNEAERGTEGALVNSSIEMFLMTGLGDLPYHQMIIHADGTPIEYYEWQTEYRDNRPLKGNSTVVIEEIPTGWGTVVQIPWETFYENVPLNGEDWKFAMIRWAAGGESPTWGKKVHQVGQFNTLNFPVPTAEQRMAIQRHVIAKAWEDFNAAAAEATAAYADDAAFMSQYVQPMIAAAQAKGSQIPNLASLTAAQLDELYANIKGWFEFDYDVQDARIEYVSNKLLGAGGPPPTDITDPNALTVTGDANRNLGQSFDLTVEIVNLDAPFTTMDVVVHYDPAQVEFDLVGDEGAQELAASVIETLRDNFSLLGSAVKPTEGQIRLILGSSGELYAIQEDGALFAINGKVKGSASIGETTISLSDALASNNGVGSVLNTSHASFTITVAAVDKAALQAAIASAQAAHDAAVEGTAPGQYPAGSKAALQSAINAAAAVLADNSATQAQVDQAVSDLNAALAAFQASVVPGDRSALLAKIDEAEQMLAKAVEGNKLGQYVVGSKAALQAAINAANAAGTSQADIDQAIANLQAAMNVFASKFISLVEGAASITINDLSIMSKYYGITSEDEGWSEIEAADVLEIGVIDIRNLSAVAQMILDEWRAQ